MHRTNLLTATLLLLGATHLAAQEMPPKPPAELAKLERMMGNWQGTGSSCMEAGGETSAWTSTTTVRKALNGFFLQEDVVIDFGEGGPGPIVFRTFHGYDTKRQRYVSCGISNMGPPTLTDVHWADADTMVSAEIVEEGGQVIVDRWITKLGKDEISFEGYRTVGAAEPFLHVQGSMRRAEKPVEPRAIDAAHAFITTTSGPEMKKLLRMAGSYTVTCESTPGPGAETVTIGAKETLEPLFDDTLLVASVIGDEQPGIGVYEAFGAFGWHAEKECYVSIYVNNMGEMAKTETRWVEGKLVSTDQGMTMGQPMVMRNVIEVDEAGRMQRVYSNIVSGAHEPRLAFDARYVRE